jgi:hypothetical protein
VGEGRKTQAIVEIKAKGREDGKPKLEMAEMVGWLMDEDHRPVGR